MPKMTTAIAAPAATLCLLSVLWADRAMHRPSDADSAPYLQSIRHQAEALPTTIGSWQGTDAPVPPSAAALLRPHVIISRTYRNTLSGQQAALLLVYCQDVRDLIVNCPPLSYVGQGWTLQSTAAQDRQIGEEAVAVTRYQFSTNRAGHGARIAVDHLFVLPGRRICRDMSGMDSIVRDHRGKALGAAQVQIVSDGSISDRERDELLAMFVRAARPVIDAISQGVSE